MFINISTKRVLHKMNDNISIHVLMSVNKKSIGFNFLCLGITLKFNDCNLFNCTQIYN